MENKSRAAMACSADDATISAAACATPAGSGNTRSWGMAGMPRKVGPSGDFGKGRASEHARRARLGLRWELRTAVRLGQRNRYAQRLQFRRRIQPLGGSHQPSPVAPAKEGLHER